MKLTIPDVHETLLDGRSLLLSQKLNFFKFQQSGSSYDHPKFAVFVFAQAAFEQNVKDA